MRQLRAMRPTADTLAAGLFGLNDQHVTTDQFATTDQHSASDQLSSTTDIGVGDTFTSSSGGTSSLPLFGDVEPRSSPQEEQQKKQREHWEIVGEQSASAQV